MNGLIDNNSKGKKASAEQREKLGLAPAPKGKASRTPPDEPTNALQQVEVHNCVIILVSTSMKVLNLSFCEV